MYSNPIPGKETRYPLYRRLGGPQGRSGWVLKISPQPGFDLRTVQPVESRYTDYAIPAQLDTVVSWIYRKQMSSVFCRRITL
jgi:hypothetical protein